MDIINKIPIIPKYNLQNNIKLQNERIKQIKTEMKNEKLAANKKIINNIINNLQNSKNKRNQFFDLSPQFLKYFYYLTIIKIVRRTAQSQVKQQKKFTQKIQDGLADDYENQNLNQNYKFENSSAELTQIIKDQLSNTPPGSTLVSQSLPKKVKYIPIGGIVPQGVEKPQIILLKHSEYIDFKKVHVDDPITCDCEVHQKGDCIHNHHCDLHVYNIECPRGSHYDENGHEIDCGNQKCQRCQYAKNEVRYCGMKGFGLFATQKVKKGQFVIEYVGEILNRDHILERITSQSFYAMHLQGKQYLDATYKGNQSRFINHSHDPNLEIRKVYVNDEIHMCMFALRDIKENEEFTFDYQLEYVGGPSIKCLCGAKNCTGYLLKNPNE